MLNIYFYPEFNEQVLIQACGEYRKIWNTEGVDITNKLEELSGLSFVENEVNALVFEGRSYSRPLQLRASYSYEDKRNALVHELCHRLCTGNKIYLEDDGVSKLLRAHKMIFLILYDALAALYGSQVAENNRAKESSYNDAYREAWDWALSMSRKERQTRFERIKTDKS